LEQIKGRREQKEHYCRPITYNYYCVCFESAISETVDLIGTFLDELAISRIFAAQYYSFLFYQLGFVPYPLLLKLFILDAICD